MDEPTRRTPGVYSAPSVGSSSWSHLALSTPKSEPWSAEATYPDVKLPCGALLPVAILAAILLNIQISYLFLREWAAQMPWGGVAVPLSSIFPKGRARRPRLKSRKKLRENPYLEFRGLRISNPWDLPTSNSNV